MELVSAALVAVSIVLLMQYPGKRSRRRASTLAAAGLAGPVSAVPDLRSRFAPVIRGWLTWLGRVTSRRVRKDLEELIAESGVSFSTLHFQGLRCSTGLAAALLPLPLGFAALLLSPFFFALGYYLPVIFIKMRRRRQRERMARDLPEMVDLLAILCYSGESLFLALQHCASACGHLSTRHEIEAILERVRLGESTAEALRHNAHHPCRELRRFSRTLLRAEEHGAPIADTLEELATELRSGRREKERVQASRASVLILFPLVFLILPSFLLLTVGGMILGYTL